MASTRIRSARRFAQPSFAKEGRASARCRRASLGAMPKAAPVAPDANFLA